jgi:hypothetical protein
MPDRFLGWRLLRMRLSQNASQSRSTLVLFVSVCVNVAYGTPASPCKDAAPVFRRAPIIEGGIPYMLMDSRAHQKVTTAHLSRLAYLYVRQSTLRLVLSAPHWLDRVLSKVRREEKSPWRWTASSSRPATHKPWIKARLSWLYSSKWDSNSLGGLK